MAVRKRDIQLIIRVNQDEREKIKKKMEQFGTTNMASYIRKIAIDGFIVHLELPELREMVSLLRRSSNSLNQIAKRLNETGRIYDADMEDVLQNQERLWQAAMVKAKTGARWPLPRTCSARDFTSWPYGLPRFPQAARVCASR